MHERLTAGIATGADQAGLVERLSRLLMRVPVTLALREGGVAELAFARQSTEPNAESPRCGTWALEDGRVAVRADESVEDAKQGTAALSKDRKRLRFEWGAWSLLLQRK